MASVREVIEQNEYGSRPVGLAKSHGERAIPELLQLVTEWELSRAVCRALEEYPLAVKRRAIHPELVRMCADFFCRKETYQEKEVSYGYVLERVLPMLVHESHETPDLPAQLCQAMQPNAKKVLNGYRFEVFTTYTRHPATFPLLPVLENIRGFSLLALLAPELAPFALERTKASLEQGYAVEFYTLAAALLAPAETGPLLRKAMKASQGNLREIALALAFLGDAGDAPLVKGTKGLGLFEKRAFAALVPGKAKDRIAALDKLDDSPQGRLAMAWLIADADPAVARAALARLKAVAKPPYEDDDYYGCLWHGAFARRAPELIARGVSTADYQTLEHLAGLFPFPPTLPKPTASAPAQAKAGKTEATPIPKELAGPCQKLGEAMHRLAKLEAAEDDEASVPGAEVLGLASGVLVKAGFDDAFFVDAATGKVRAAQPDGTPEGKALGTLDDVLAKVLAGIAAQEALFAKVKKAAGMMDAIKALKRSLNEKEYFDEDGTTVKREKDYLVFACYQTDHRYRIRRATGVICAAHSNKVLFPDIDAALAEIEADLHGLERKAGVASTAAPAAPEPKQARAADPSAARGKVKEVLAGLKQLKMVFDPKPLPALVPVGGGKADVAALDVLQGLKAELGGKKALGLVAALEGAFTPESLDAFVAALAQQWEKLGAPSGDRWAFDALGALGGDLAAAYVGEHLADWSHQRALQGMELLRQIDSPLAIHAVYALAVTPSKYQPRRDAADEILEKIANARSLDVPVMLDQSVPCPADAKVREGVVAIQTRRLEQDMIDGRRRAGGDFKKFVVEHALLSPLAQRVIWGEYDGKDKLVTTFRVAEDRTLSDAEDRAFKLTSGRSVGVAHPAELDEAGRKVFEKWAGLFKDYRLEPLFPQAARPVFTLEEKERSLKELTRFAGRRMGFYAIESGMHARGWQTWEVGDQGGTESFAREFARDDVMIEARLADNGGTIKAVTCKKAFGSLHPVTVSEILHDLEAITAKAGGSEKGASPGAKPAASGAGLPQTGRHPFAELAKSSRSICVVCSKPIAKDTVRIGIERMIETPQFTGKGTAWCHADCRANAPELAGLADLEARLKKNSAGVWK